MGWVAARAFPQRSSRLSKPTAIASSSLICPQSGSMGGDHPLIPPNLLPLQPGPVPFSHMLLVFLYSFLEVLVFSPSIFLSRCPKIFLQMHPYISINLTSPRTA